MALLKTMFLVAAIWMSLATLPGEPKEAPSASSPFAWRFFLTENWTEHAAAYKGKNWKGALLATADCPLAGCQKPLSLNFPKFNKINIGKWPMICFFYDQTLDYCKNDYVEQSLGCPYKTCRYHISQKVSDDKAALNTVYKKNSLFKTAEGYSLIIWDLWDPRWTSKVRGGAYVSYYAPPGIFIWCNGTLTKNFSLPKDSPQLCLPVTLVPQLNLLTPADVAQRMLDPPRRSKRAVFLPLVAGIALASSAVAAGLAGGSLGYSIHSYSSLSQQFEVAIEASAESLASLQRQLSSLAWVTLQNRRALDLLTADKEEPVSF